MHLPRCQQKTTHAQCSDDVQPDSRPTNRPSDGDGLRRAANNSDRLDKDATQARSHKTFPPPSLPLHPPGDVQTRADATAWNERETSGEGNIARTIYIRPPCPHTHLPFSLSLSNPAKINKHKRIPGSATDTSEDCTIPGSDLLSGCGISSCVCQTTLKEFSCQIYFSAFSCKQFLDLVSYSLPCPQPSISLEVAVNICTTPPPFSSLRYLLRFLFTK